MYVLTDVRAISIKLLKLVKVLPIVPIVQTMFVVGAVGGGGMLVHVNSVNTTFINPVLPALVFYPPGVQGTAPHNQLLFSKIKEGM